MGASGPDSGARGNKAEGTIFIRSQTEEGAKLEPNGAQSRTRVSLCKSTPGASNPMALTDPAMNYYSSGAPSIPLSCGMGGMQ